MGKKIEKWIDLSGLPRLKDGRYDWSNSVGCIMRFKYNNIEGIVEIIEYVKNDKKVKIRYKDKEIYTQFKSLINCNLGSLIGKITSDFKIEIGACFKSDKRDIVITDRYYKKESGRNRKYYRFHCNLCGWDEGEMLEYSLTKNMGCACCSNKTVVQSINSIYKTDRWMCDLGMSEEDAKTHTYGSCQKVEVVCPDCGKHKYIRINSLYSNKKISCECCDGVSFGEKCVMGVLNQLKIQYEREKVFDWSKNITHKNPKLCGDKRYDFYLEKYNTICEVMGIQHYEQTTRKGNPKLMRNLNEEQKNDKIKFNLSVSNNISNYIIIDARVSNIDYIKNSFLCNESANKIFGDKINNINWTEVEKYALYSNLKKQICLYKLENQNATTTEIKNIFNLSQKAVIKYLKDGMKIWDWAKDVYNPYLEKEKSWKKKKNGKRVAIFNSEGVGLGVYESCKEIERRSLDLFGEKFYDNHISQCCRKKIINYKGFTFRYVDQSTDQENPKTF